METRANYVLIGAFVFIAAAALMLFTVWVSGGSLSREYATYDVVFEGPVNGLTEGGEVRFNGIKVGEVQRLSLDRQDPNRVIARIRVDAQTPVRTDSVAQLDFLGITGVTFIQIRAGSPEAPMVPQSAMGEAPPVILTERTALDELFSGGQDMLTVMGETINRVNEALSEENVASITATLNNVEIITAKLAQDDGVMDAAAGALRSVDKAAVALAAAATSIDGAAGTIDAGFGDLSADARVLLDDLGPAMADMRKALAGLNGTITTFNRDVTPSAARAMEQFSQAAIDLRSTMLRLQGLVGEIEQDPSRFVYRQPLPVEGN
jgi:phospholipid/cholesterol/gamma-HCH transport system substrate-binding protein